MLEVEDLTFTYLGQDEPALAGVSFSVAAGGVLGVLGPVGAGKTTLCLCLAGLMPRVFGGRLSGMITVAGLNPRETRSEDYAKAVGIVFEDYSAQLTQIRVLDEVAAPLQNWGVPPEEATDRARKLLSRLGLDQPGIEDKRTWELSGGQQQRLAVAAALAMEPDLLLLDNITTMLDPEGKQEVRRIIAGLAGQSTLVVVDDDTDFLGDVTDQVLLLSAGRTVTIAPTNEVLRNHNLLRSSGVMPPVTLRAAHRLGLPGNPLTITEFSELLTHDHRRSFAPARVTERATVTRNGKGRSHDTVLEVHGVGYRYPDGTTALHGADLSVQVGEVHGLLGGNGAGKTTLAKIIVGLLRPDHGSVHVAGCDVTTGRARDLAGVVGTAFQNPDEMLSERTVRDELAFPLRRRQYERHGLFTKRQRYDDDYIAAKVARAVELIGLDPGLLDHDPSSLPFGQRKLVTLAAAVVLEPALTVFDEPGTGLDAASHAIIEQAVQRLRTQGVAVILVEHEIDLVGQLTDSVTIMDNGEVALQGPTSSVFHSDNWDRLLDLHILPPRAARLGHALGLQTLSLDELTAALKGS